jgi:L-2-hydroxyglutarate oxidase LhgO
MSEQADAVVVGAGVIGLAIARRLAVAGREVIVLEAAEAIGTVTSSRNSEVIHAGIYYATGSLKAQLCVAGRDALYRYCTEHGIPHRRLTKLIVATDESQLPALSALRRQSVVNGAGDLRPLTGAEAKALEPALACVAALESPTTGIVDSHAYMLSLRGDAEAHGAAFALNAPMIGGRVGDDMIELRVGGTEPLTLRCRTVVNSAGLGAQAVARSIAGVPPHTIPPLHYAKGNYYAPAGVRPAFTRLVYPMPNSAGLGVHVTLDMDGRMRFGPDVEWVDRISYDVDPARAASFYEAVRTYWPGLPDGCLQPAYSGIRPKLQAPGEPARDFVIQGPREHGIPGLVNLYGMESPGLTSSLAIADYVSEMIGVPVAA